MTDPADSIRAKLLDDGFAIVPEVLGRAGVDLLRALCDRRVAAASAAHLAANRTTGSMLGVEADPAFAELIAWRPALDVIRSLGFGQLAWSAGYVISKPPGGPRLFWHQDWLWWTHPLSADPVPHQLFAMYYAVDTDRANGCLRVVPGSHRQHLPAHDRLATAHSAAALAGEDAGAPMFGEIDVPVKAGDLLIGDSRLLHAAHANTGGVPRTLLTLWYHPAYDKLAPELQNYLAEHHGASLSGWEAEDRNRIDCTLPYRTQYTAAWPIERTPQWATSA